MRSVTNILATFLLFLSTVSSASLLDGLVAHYRFDGNALDSGPNGHHGTAIGGVTFEAGVYGQAARFDGFSGFVATNSSVGNLGNDATLAFWYQPDPISFTRPTRIFEKDDRAYWAFGTVSDGKSALSFSLRQTNNYGPPQTEVTVGAPSSMIGIWTHVLLRKKGLAVDFFLNGQLMDSVTTPVTAVSTTAPLYFGKSYYWNKFYYAGMIDDARVYNRALSDLEIGQLAMVPGLIALTSSMNPAPFGQPITFTGALKNARNPTGRMNFSVDGSALAACTDVPVVNASAVCTTTGISPGTHVILARYTGDSQNMAAEATLTQVIQPSIITFPLTVNNANPGGGTVSSAPAGIECGVSCTYSFNQGVQVTLTAYPANGFFFSGWGGACSGATACVLTMDDANNVNAQFVSLPKYPLKVVRAASGIVTSTPEGIDCGARRAACRGEFATVTLRATPLPGYAFKKWVGCPAPTGPTCALTLTRTTQVQAQFLKIPSYAIKVTKNTLGAVTSAPEGLKCGAKAKNCAARFITGTTLTLTAQPVPGAIFLGWTGACTGNGLCVVTLNGSKKVTAKFQRSSNAAWLGDWVQVNFLGASDNGAWGEDNPSGLGFVARITGQTWIETDDYGDGCAITYTYTIQTNGRYTKKAIGLGNNCPAMSLPSLRESGKLQFANENGHAVMYEYFTLAAGDEIIAFKWMKL